MGHRVRAGLVSALGTLIAWSTASAGEFEILESASWAIAADANAINEDGVVVGVNYNAIGRPFPVRWDADGLDVLAGPVLIPGSDCEDEACPLEGGAAWGINEDGVIAGNAFALGQAWPAVWDDRTRVWRALPRPVAVNTPVRGINDHGDVVGTSAGSAVLWRDGAAEVLPRLNPDTPFCSTFAVNNAAEVTGYCYAADGSHTVPVVWTDGQPRRLRGTPKGGDFAYGRAINDHGEIVGIQRFGARLWLADAAQPVHLTPVGAANGINDHGDVVGYEGVNGGAPRATLWRADGTVVDIGLLPDGNFSFARAISDAGWVVGLADECEPAADPDEPPVCTDRAFVWRP